MPMNEISIANYAWLELDNIESIHTDDILHGCMNKDEMESAYFLVKTLSDPKYVHLFGKLIMNMEFPPHQCIILQEIWKHKFPMFIGSRGVGKTSTLAMYCVIRSMLIPETKIVLTGSGFRQSKIIFEYIKGIWEKAPILRDICSNDSGPKQATDMWTFQLNQSKIIAIPMGSSGDKVRGLRANVIICDEFSCLEANVLVPTSQGLYRIEDLKEDMPPVFTGNSETPIEKPFRFIQTPPTDVYEVTTKYGYKFGCSNIHKVFLADGTIKYAKDLQKGDMLDLNNHYEFPEEYIYVDNKKIDENIAWTMGVLVSEGSINARHQISVTGTDKNFIDRYNNSLLEHDNTIHITDSLRDAYEDPRGWKCKKSYISSVCNLNFREWLVKAGLERGVAENKKIPWSILRSPKSVVIAFLAGLFEGDGSCFVWSNREIPKLGVSYYSVCENLCREVQTLLRTLNIVCQINHRASKISKNRQWFLRLNGNYAIDFANMLKIPKWQKSIDQVKRSIKWSCVVKMGKRFAYRVNNKVLFSSENHKEVLDFAQKAEHIRRNNICLPVISVKKREDKQVLYDIELKNTHAFYGNGIKQHNSTSTEIYEQVIQGFTATASDPIEKMKIEAKREYLIKRGLWNAEMEVMHTRGAGNQSIISGTCGYDFEHFAKYWRNYKEIITGKKQSDDGVDPTDYCVIRYPYELIPKGIMDAKTIARAKAINTESSYRMEYCAVFVKDSEGFFKRTLIESCVAKESNAIIKDEKTIVFDAVVYGENKKEYIISVDPASETDNLAVVVIEVHNNHRRVVYCWTINKKRHRKQVESNKTTIENYYAYCARKIRDLMLLFPTKRIVIDSQGGGYAIIEALHDKNIVVEGEDLLWPVVDPEKEQDTDHKQGLHIIHPINFAKEEFTLKSNEGLKKDLETKTLLFPKYDGITLSVAVEKDIENKENEINFDSLENCIYEIEELKDELTTIVCTKLPSGRYRWDTPEQKVGNKKGRMRKDRYSALLMGNYVAREMFMAEPPIRYNLIGGLTTDIVTNTNMSTGKMYENNGWYNIDSSVFRPIKRK